MNLLTCVVKMFVSLISGTDDMSISGFKDAIAEQNTGEALMVQEKEGAVSPDTGSAASHSTDEPTKDIVSHQTLQCLQKVLEITGNIGNVCFAASGLCCSSDQFAHP